MNPPSFLCCFSSWWICKSILILLNALGKINSFAFLSSSCPYLFPASLSGTVHSCLVTAPTSICSTGIFGDFLNEKPSIRKHHAVHYYKIWNVSFQSCVLWSFLRVNLCYSHCIAKPVFCFNHFFAKIKSAHHGLKRTSWANGNSSAFWGVSCTVLCWLLITRPALLPCKDI